MEHTALKLVMIDGPRKGETLDFEAKSTIRIGRVVRGNNVTIKDSGISSKHLLIGFESGKWTVQDLDSSNGTLLNSTPLPPFTPFDLHHRDTLKLGEVTSILLHFQDVRARTGAASGSAAKGRVEIDKNVEKLEECVPVEEKPRRGRPRRGRVLDRVPEVERPEVNESGKDDKELEIRGSVVDKPEMEEKARRGRPRRGKVLDRVPEAENNVGAVAEKPEVNESEKDDGCLVADKELVESVNVRVTRSRKIVKPSVLENLGGEDGVVKRLGRGRRKNLLPGNVQVGVRVDERVNEGEQEKVNEVIVIDSENENAGLGQETFDFEKGTIGQWLDFMEVHMPKQITQAAEAMIEEMRKKAERVAEYTIEQKKAKAALLKKN